MYGSLFVNFGVMVMFIENVELVGVEIVCDVGGVGDVVKGRGGYVDVDVILNEVLGEGIGVELGDDIVKVVSDSVIVYVVIIVYVKGWLVLIVRLVL